MYCGRPSGPQDPFFSHLSSCYHNVGTLRLSGLFIAVSPRLTGSCKFAAGLGTPDHHTVDVSEVVVQGYIILVDEWYAVGIACHRRWFEPRGRLGYTKQRGGPACSTCGASIVLPLLIPLHIQTSISSQDACVQIRPRQQQASRRESNTATETFCVQVHIRCQGVSIALSDESVVQVGAGGHSSKAVRKYPPSTVGPAPRLQTPVHGVSHLGSSRPCVCGRGEGLLWVCAEVGADIYDVWFIVLKQLMPNRQGVWHRHFQVDKHLQCLVAPTVTHRPPEGISCTSAGVRVRVAVAVGLHVG